MSPEEYERSRCITVNFMLLEAGEKGEMDRNACITDEMIVPHCDCSDPENYSYYDKGVF